jgi:hypothetical protein
MGRLAGTVEGDDDRKADGHFGGGDGDDEEDEYLRVEVLVTRDKPVARRRPVRDSRR